MKRFVLLALMAAFFLSLGAQAMRAQDEKVLFKKEPQPEPIAAGDAYIIGPEDVIYIHVWKEDALSRTVPVRSDGKISLPLVDDVAAAGLTPLQLKDVLVTRFGQYIDSPTISVVVTEANSFKVFLSGEVKTPGVIRLRSETTIMQLIPMAGGFTEWANQKKILLIRKEKGRERRFIINYKNIVDGREPNANIVLKSGDTIIVP